jgi:LytS/YehU family sensor histidine kinase
MRRLLWAVIISATLSAAIVVPIMYWMKIHDIWWNLMGKTKPIPPMSLALVGNIVHFAVYCVLFIAVAEVLKRRALTSSAIHASQREQAEIAREVLESRLAAMQAQVEPQFLFNSLVDIESLYRKDAQRAADDLDRLITYLRVALPRLREPGSTIEAEIELVQAYLAVVTSLHGGRPSLTVTLGDDCRSARFYPMLLLPLVQRAVRQPAGGLPDSIRIGVQRAGDDIAIVTRIAGAGGCTEDFELARVRERLQGLYGTRASLDCAELDPSTTQFIMRIPGDDRD